MAERTPEQLKREAAFTVKLGKRYSSQAEYLVERKDRSVEWPTDDELLLLCDSDWNAVHDKSRPFHFGGRVERGQTTESVKVIVYID